MCFDGLMKSRHGIFGVGFIGIDQQRDEFVSPQPGEEVQFDMDGTLKHYRVESIEPFVAAPPAAPSP